MDNHLVISVTVKRPANEAQMDAIQVRLFSEWLQCSCTSPKFGDQEILPWKEHDEEKKAATFETKASYDISSPDKLKMFNEKPGVYIVVLKDSSPLGFTYVDCSSFVLEAGSCFARNVSIAGYNVDATVTIVAPMLSLESSIKLEPVVLDVKRYACVTFHSHGLKPLTSNKRCKISLLILYCGILVAFSYWGVVFS